MILITPKETHRPLAITPDTLSPLPQETTHWLSVSLDLPILDVSYKWNHKIQIHQFCNFFAYLCVLPLPPLPLLHM